MILKGVEVVCFDTLLQVLILKEMEEGQGIGEERKGLGYTPVATGSMRNVLRTGEMLTPRGADEGTRRRLRKYTRGCGRRKGRSGDTVSRTLT